MPGCQWGHIELRCSSRTVRVLGELPQASGDLYNDPTQSDIDGDSCQNNSRVTFGACLGFEAN
jgi:hypothetical protein